MFSKKIIISEVKWFLKQHEWSSNGIDSPSRSWVQSGILGQRPESSKKGHFLRCFTQICLKIILFLQKRLILSNITRGSVRLPDAEFCWNITLGKRKIKYPKVYHGIVYYNLSGVFIANFQKISNILLVFSLLTLSK